jgi:hypothetical protein
VETKDEGGLHLVVQRVGNSKQILLLNLSKSIRHRKFELDKEEKKKRAYRKRAKPREEHTR